MSKRDEKKTSLTTPADAVSAFAHYTPGTVAAGLNGLEKEGSLTANPVYPEGQPAAEAKDAPPVAGGLDSTPTNWFEMAVDLCAKHEIPEDRFFRAVEAVTQAVRR